MQRNWRELIRPKKLEVDPDDHSRFYGKFVCEPLERGFGVTIGNSLRRVLISSLQGAAIVSVKIEGVLHEFSTIPGVVEDVTDIILNLKEVRCKLRGEEPRTIKINKSGEGLVKAKDILTDPQVEILNPEQHIATLSIDGISRPKCRSGRVRAMFPPSGIKRKTPRWGRFFWTPPFHRSSK